MTSRFVSALAATVLLSMPGAVLAQTAMHDDAMHGDAAMHASMVCREAVAGEKPNAMMMAGSKGMVCKSLAKEMSAKRMGPDLSGALTPAQIDAAWQKWLNTVIVIPMTGP
jgi:hypothetical protein